MEREAEQQRETEVGAFLRTHRLRVGLTLSETSDALCIREAYLKAIEDGRFGDLPGPTYVTGFIRTYAEHLGLDGNEIVRQFRAEPLRMEGSADLRFPSPMSEGGMPSGALLLLAVFVALVAYGAWYVSSMRDGGVAELISPLPERLVAFLSDGSSAADEENSAQRKTAPEMSRRQGTAPVVPQAQATPQAPAEQASRAVSPENPRTETAPLATPETGDQNKAVSPSEPGSASVSAHSPAGTQDEEDATDAAGSQTATRENPGDDRDAGDTEPRASAATPVSSRDADEQATSEATAASEPPLSPSPPADTDTAGASEARIVLKAKGENWVEIREEGTDRQVVARLLKPGDTYSVPNIPGLKLLTGNAGGLEIYVDGEPVPSLGVEGMVRRNIPLDAEQLRSGALAR